MTIDPATGKEQEGYVSIDASDPTPVEISDVDAVVLEHMPEDEKKILEKKAANIGFGQEPEVIIDTTGDRLAPYED